MNILPPEKADATGPCYGGHRKTGNRLAQRQLVQAGIHRACRGLAPCRAHPPAPPDRGSPGIYNMVHRFCISAPPSVRPPHPPPQGGGVTFIPKGNYIDSAPPKRARPETHAPKRDASPGGHAQKHMPRSVRHVAPYKEGDKAPPPIPPLKGGGVTFIPKGNYIDSAPPSRRARPETHAPKRNASHAGHAQKRMPRSVRHVAPYKEGDKAPPPHPPPPQGGGCYIYPEGKLYRLRPPQGGTP